MLALEDGSGLRLLEGIGDAELAMGEPFRIQGSPTRFGRIRVSLELAGRNGWRVDFERAVGASPGAVQVTREVRLPLSPVPCYGGGFKAEGR